MIFRRYNRDRFAVQKITVYSRHVKFDNLTLNLHETTNAKKTEGKIREMHLGHTHTHLFRPSNAPIALSENSAVINVAIFSADLAAVQI